MTTADDPHEALERTRRKLAEAKAKGPLIQRVSASLEKMAEENNFTWRLAELFRGGRA